MAILDDRLKRLKVFVNYRRSDEKIFVELLRTHFMFRYGQENVFMDFDSLPPFTNFRASSSGRRYATAMWLR